MRQPSPTYLLGSETMCTSSTTTQQSSSSRRSKASKHAEEWQGQKGGYMGEVNYREEDDTRANEIANWGGGTFNQSVDRCVGLLHRANRDCFILVEGREEWATRG